MVQEGGGVGKVAGGASGVRWVGGMWNGKWGIGGGGRAAGRRTVGAYQTCEWGVSYAGRWCGRGGGVG